MGVGSSLEEGSVDTVVGADLRAALVASCFRGACKKTHTSAQHSHDFDAQFFQSGRDHKTAKARLQFGRDCTLHTGGGSLTLPPVDFRAVCFVRAISVVDYE